jgi:SnoaL-like polyketide cyclase
MTTCSETTLNKEVVRHIVEEIWKQGRLDLMSTYYSPDFRNFGRVLPLERFRQIIFEAWRTGFPDIHFHLEDQLAEGDQVFCHFTAFQRNSLVFQVGAVRRYTTSGMASNVLPPLFLCQRSNY